MVLVAIGGAIVYRISHLAPSQATDTSSQNQVAGDSTAAKPADNQPVPSTTPTNQSAQSETMNNCTRTFDENKLRTAKVDIANRFVVLNVKGYGAIKIQFYDKDAPKTVENFLRLVNSGFYDCLTFHRIAKGFVIQSGDPTGTGSGGQSAFGGAFSDELNANTPSYKAGYLKGVVAMANSGPNTNGSQFFIMLGDAQLPHNYTIFGKVVDGQAAVDKIGQVDITPQLGPTDGAPKTKVVIEKASIVSK